MGNSLNMASNKRRYEKEPLNIYTKALSRFQQRLAEYNYLEHGDFRSYREQANEQFLRECLPIQGRQEVNYTANSN